MMAITTKSSTSVNPFLRVDINSPPRKKIKQKQQFEESGQKRIRNNPFQIVSINAAEVGKSDEEILMRLVLIVDEKC